VSICSNLSRTGEFPHPSAGTKLGAGQEQRMPRAARRQTPPQDDPRCPNKESLAHPLPIGSWA